MIKLNLVFIFLAFSISPKVLAQGNAMPKAATEILSNHQQSFENLKQQVEKLFFAYLSDLIEKIKQGYPTYATSATGLEVLHYGVCVGAAKSFAEILRQNGLPVEIKRGSHFFLTTEIEENGKKIQVIIDPTFRQFLLGAFLPGQGESFDSGYWIGKNPVKSFQQKNIPAILIVRKADLQSTYKYFYFPTVLELFHLAGRPPQPGNLHSKTIAEIYRIGQ